MRSSKLGRKISFHQYHFDGINLKETNKVRKDLGLSPIVPTKVKCLRCEKEFLSYGKFNRMCASCSDYACNNQFCADDYSV